MNDLVGAADLRKRFSKSDTTNCSYVSYKITVINSDTIPSYEIVNSKESYNDSLLKNTDLTVKENKDVMKNLKTYFVLLHLF